MAGWKLRKDKTQAETAEEEIPAPPPQAEAAPENHTPGNHVPRAELPDDLLPLPAVTHWEMPAEEWTAPAAPVIAEPIQAVPVEDEPVFAEEMQHEHALQEETQPEEVHYRFAPLDLGGNESADTMPQFDTEEDEDAEPAPHFEDDEELPGQAIDFAATPVELKEITPPLPPAEPEIVPEPEIVAAPEPVIVPKPEPKATAEPKKRKAVATSSAASEPEAIAPPEPEAIAPPEPEAIAPPEPEAIAPPEPEVIAPPEPEVIAASPVIQEPVIQEPEAVAAPVPPAAPEPPLFPLPSPALPEIAASTLRSDRSEMPSAIPPPVGFSVPPVAPFLLDVPKTPMQEPPHTLLVRIGRLSATFEMTKEVTVIGRPDSELHFYPDIEIEMDDAVSRRHAEILRHEDDYYLVDAGSTNGTLLNGETLTPHEERKLAHGDRIRVGERTEIIFE